MFALIISPKAQKALKKIPKRYEFAINESLLLLKEDPFRGKPLINELAGRYSLKMGVYRIIYKINQNSKIIFVINADHRSKIYK